MSTYKRWFPPQGTTMTPGFILFERNHRKQGEKLRQQAELRVWDAEGGHPVPHDVALPLQSSLFPQTPGEETIDPPLKPRVYR